MKRLTRSAGLYRATLGTDALLVFRSLQDDTASADGRTTQQPR
uniref:Uncharacterized protein n=1 Tax=Klebsiella pneumoniae TaxID=573 RepID=A0A2P1BPI9_KLEPN|nr:hypothetical protein [Klebsiella pneumoniae]